MNIGLAEGTPRTEPVSWRGLPALRLALDCGDEVILLHRGAQVVSWRTADGCEQLFMSDLANLSEGAALRGGIPVCFPQFAGRGPLPQHGFVRTRDWQPAPDGEGLCMRLDDDEATRALWPHCFQLALKATPEKDVLQIGLSVTNTGDAPFTFMAALHTYLAVQDATQCSLRGLPAGSVFDNFTGLRAHTAGESPDFTLLEQRPIDAVHAGVGRALTLSEAGRETEVEASMFTDCVVWNPGAGRARMLADLPAEDWRRFVCIEAACIESPVTLPAGACWTGGQRLRRKTG